MLKTWLGRYLLKVNNKDTRTMFIGDFELIFASRIVGLVSEIYFNRFQWNLKLKKKKLLPLSPQEFLVLSLQTSEGWKAVDLGATQCFRTKDP